MPPTVFDLRDQSSVFAIVMVLVLSVVLTCSDSETRFQSVLPFASIACRASDVNVWRTESSSLHFQICQFLMPRVRSAEFPIPFQAQEAWARRTSMSFMSHALHDARAQKLVHVQQTDDKMRYLGPMLKGRGMSQAHSGVG